MKTSMSWTKWKIVISANGKSETIAYFNTKREALNSLSFYMKKDESCDVWYDTKGNKYTIEK